MADNKIRLEDLLALKRAERPTEREWSEFDAKLKDKLVERIVRNPSVFERIAARFSTGRAVMLGAASAAFMAAVFAPIYVSSSVVQMGTSMSPSVVSASRTPLPTVAASFAVNELDSGAEASESPVLAPMSSSELPAVRYVSNHLDGTSFLF